MRRLNQRSGEITLGDVDFRVFPFRYFLAQHCVADHTALALLEWFESGAPWRLVATDFYEQYEFSMLDTVLPENVSHLVAPSSFEALRREMASIFGVAFDEHVMLVAHKLMRGQRIAIHNDYLLGQETHRLTIQLNRGLRDGDGGYFLLFDSVDPRDIHRIVRPLHCSAIGFEIGEASNHAVSRLQCGERYTLVYSFHAQDHAQGPSESH